MNRLGLDNKDNITEIVNNTKLNIEGIYTHFATTGFLDKEWDNQLNNFKIIIIGLIFNNLFL
jgi:alanine racemase